MLEAVLRLLARLTALVPCSWLRGPGAVLGFLAGSVLRIRRRHVTSAMRRAGVPDAERTASAMYRHLGTSIFELLWLSGASPRRRERVLDDYVILDEPTRAVLRSARARGALVLGASHTGNWEIAAYATARFLRREQARLKVVAKPLHVRGFHAFCSELRERCGLSVVSPGGALREIQPALREGDALAMLIDQVPDHERHAVALSFLGARASADRAPASVARVAQGTLVVTAVEREGARHRLRVLDVIDVPDRRRADARAMTERASSALDAFVRRRPADWLWLHRRWRTPDATPLVPTEQPD